MEEVTLPNLEVRIGAFFALRRIAKDSSEDRHDILDMLCAYVRENAPVDGAIKSPHEVHKELSEGVDQSPPLNDHDIFKHSDYQSANTIGINPTELNEETLMDWSRKLPPARMDIQMAVDVIGGIRQTFPETAGQHRIDLSLANLQNLRLDGTFSNTNFDSARLDNAEFSGEFCNSTFIKASLQKAHSRASNFIDCDFSHANLYGSFFGLCDCSQSLFCSSWMKSANFNGATLKACDFYQCETPHVFCFQNADASYSRFSNAPLDSFAGLNEGPSENLWVNSETQREKINESRLRQCKDEFLSASEDREQWQQSWRGH